MVCTGQPVGAACTSDSPLLCASGVCFQNACLAGPQSAGSMCDSNGDCISTCVQGTCTDGLQPIGSACDDDSDCLNSVCALETFASSSSSAKQVCCPTGDSEFFFGVAEVCTGQLAGATCGSSDTLCQSGTCFQRQCQEALQANGRPCDTNEDCTGTCVGGVCKSALQSAGAACDDNSDCANNVCALETASSTSTVCCPSGRFIFAVTFASGVGFICVA
jgi:hypothetical protein